MTEQELLEAIRDGMEEIDHTSSYIFCLNKGELLIRQVGDWTTPVEEFAIKVKRRWTSD